MKKLLILLLMLIMILSFAGCEKLQNSPDKSTESTEEASENKKGCSSLEKAMEITKDALEDNDLAAIEGLLHKEAEAYLKHTEEFSSFNDVFEKTETRTSKYGDVEFTIEHIKNVEGDWSDFVKDVKAYIEENDLGIDFDNIALCELNCYNKADGDRIDDGFAIFVKDGGWQLFTLFPLC